MDFALNNLQRLICHKTKPNQKITRFCPAIIDLISIRYLLDILPNIE